MRLLGVFLLLLAPAWGEGGRNPVVPCPRVAQPPVLDGMLDDESWSAVRPLTVDRRDHIHPNYREGWTGPADLSAEVRTLVAGDALYLGLEIRDDTTRHESGRAWWSGDSIEVFLDTRRQGDEDDTRYSNDDLQLFLMPFHDGLRWGVVARGPDMPYPDGGLRGIRVTHRRTAVGYTVEARIPLWNLDIAPDERGCIGFDLAFNDVDEAGSTQAETYMTLSGRFELFTTPRNFASLQIGERATTPVAASERAPLVDWSLELGGRAGVWPHRPRAGRGGPRGRTAARGRSGRPRRARRRAAGHGRIWR